MAQLTPMEEYDAVKLKYVEPSRGYKLYNPLTHRFLKNIKKNRVNVLKKVEDRTQPKGYNKIHSRRAFKNN